MKKDKKVTTREASITPAAKGLADTSVPDSEQEWAIEPVGKPEEFGFPVKPTTTQTRSWMRQQLWLEAFAKCGSIGEACAATGIPVPTAEHWDSADSYGFKKRKAWAAQMAVGKLDAEINRRAVEGVDHPVIYKGQVTDTFKQYAKCGTILKSAKATNVTRQTIYNWKDNDAFGFAKRFESVHHDFREELEDIMFERLRDPKCHPVLLIFALKAHYKEKYGEAFVQQDDTAMKMLDKLTEMSQEHRKRIDAAQNQEPMDQVDQILREGRTQG